MGCVSKAPHFLGNGEGRSLSRALPIWCKTGWAPEPVFSIGFSCSQKTIRQRFKLWHQGTILFTVQMLLQH